MKFYGTVREIITKLLNLNPDDKFIFNYYDPKDKRGPEQNRRLWWIIDKIAKKRNIDPNLVYVRALEEAQVEFDYFIGLPEALPRLQKEFRGAVEVTRESSYYGHKVYVYKCFYGSSNLGSKKMADVINVVERYAGILGISTKIGE